MIEREEIETLEAKLKDNQCVAQATENHQAENSYYPSENKRLNEIVASDFGELVECDTKTLSAVNVVRIRIKWPKDKYSNYFLYDNGDRLDNGPAPFDIIRYVPKDHPAQKKLFK
jgi:hypothetical protein